MSTSHHNFVHKQFTMRMSDKKMADVMYAMLYCGAMTTSIFTLGIHNFTRSQNKTNNAWVVIALPAENVEKFAELAGVILEEPQKVKVN